MRKKLISFTLFLFSLFILSGCEPRQQETIKQRAIVMGERPAESNFLEAQQIAKIEDWKDIPGKIVNLYIFKDNGDLLIPPLQCLGVPTSSTESLEPNYSTYSFVVPVDGVDIY